jgi:germination protein M
MSAVEDETTCKDRLILSQGLKEAGTMGTMLGRLFKRAGVSALTIALLALAASVSVACGVAGQVGDGGTVSTTESPATTVSPGDSTTTTTEGTDAPDTTAPTGLTTTTVTTDGASDGATMTVRAYFTRDEKICTATRVVPKSTSVGAAAMRALLEGPTAAEKEGGMVSIIPAGTTFLGLDIKDGIATVDLSKEYGSGGGTLSMMMRLAQVVFTLTQFPTVEGVEFKLDGKAIDVLGGEGIIIDHPMNRQDYEDMSPAILVESPALGETVESPIHITGTANVFEATFRVNVVNWDGLIIADKVVTASSGTGTRGTFDVTIPFTVDKAGLGALIVFAESPKDGSQIDVVEIPLQLKK